MKLRTKIILNAIREIEDHGAAGCCGALDGQLSSPHDPYDHAQATSEAIVMLMLYFKPRNKNSLQYFWPISVKCRYRWPDGSSALLERDWYSPQHQRKCVTPRIIALQILALLSEELP